jgi:hypothetical protein
MSIIIFLMFYYNFINYVNIPMSNRLHSLAYKYLNLSYVII